MNEEIKDINILLARYITNQASESETDIVIDWINESRDNEEHYLELYNLWHDSLKLQENSIIDTEKAFDQFLHRAGAVHPEEASPVRKIFQWQTAAAAIAAVMIFTLGYYYFEKSLSYHTVSIKESPKDEIVVPKGAISRNTLRDGTIVWLNAGSSLRYDDDFGKTSRTVHLIGEGYFEIADNDKKLPFIVMTDQFTIRDIGTVFNVKAYPEDSMFETVVFNGEVSVEGKMERNSDKVQKIFLKQHQVLKVDDKDIKVVSAIRKFKINENVEVLDISSAQTNIYNGWKDDLFVFEGVSFDEISKILERRYDVKILITDQELRDYEYTGSFRNVESIYKALSIIKETTPNIDYEIRDRQVTIFKNNSTN